FASFPSRACERGATTPMRPAFLATVSTSWEFIYPLVPGISPSYNLAASHLVKNSPPCSRIEHAPRFNLVERGHSTSCRQTRRNGRNGATRKGKPLLSRTE